MFVRGGIYGLHGYVYGTFTKYAVIIEECRIVEKDKLPTVTGPLEGFMVSLVKIYEKYQGRVDGIALSMAGIIDCETGVMYTGGKLPCITNVNIVDFLKKRYEFIYVDRNDDGSGTLERGKKKSFSWYKEVIVSNGKKLGK